MIKAVSCVTFYVSDLKKAVEFYEEAFGLEKECEYSSYVGFECGGVEIGLTPRRKEEEQVSLVSPSLEFMADDVDKVYEHLESKGVKFIKEPHDEPWGGRQATFTDPDGNILEIVQVNWEKHFEASAKGAGRSRE